MRRILAAVIGLVLAAPAIAQDYPNRPIRWIVPFPPGGPTDTLSRILAAKLGDTWKAGIVIDNKGGAAGAIGTDLAAKSPPDGYTIQLGTQSTNGSNKIFYPNLPYDPITDFEPLTLLAALAGVTEHLGLIATASTTYEQPYHVARKFASLDHLSGGRAGWNLVTTANPQAALNFGLDEHVEHGERYRRAREFFDVVTGLWDSWADDAFIRDVEAGIYFDPDKLHVLAHKGAHFAVRGPLMRPRPAQGEPCPPRSPRWCRRGPACGSSGP